MQITHIFGRGKETLRLKLEELATGPLLVLHYLDYGVRSALEKHPQLSEVDYQEAKVAATTLKGDDVNDFRRFLDKGTTLRGQALWGKHVRPVYLEFFDEQKKETTFWVIFAYLALGTNWTRRNIANMDDAEIKLWEEAAGEAMHYDHGVTVISR